MRWLNKTLLGLGLVFLAFLVWRVGPAELWREVRELGWGVLLLVAAEGAANAAHTAGWRHCLAQRKAQRVSLARLFLFTNAGFAINYLTPTASVGGDVTRAALLATTHPAVEPVGSVLLDKLMTAVAHLALVVIGAGVLYWRVTLPVELWVAMGATTVLLTAGITVFLLLQKYGKLGVFCRWLAARKLGGRRLEELAARVSKVDHALKDFYREHPWHLAMSALWHLVGHSAALLHAWLFLTLLGQPAPLATVAAAGFLSLWFDLLTFAVPMNLGTLEGSRILVFRALGCQALLGMTFGVAVRIAQLFWALFGLLAYSLLTLSRPEMRREASVPR